MTEVQADLFALQDLQYRAFHAKLIPTVVPERIIGVRTPALRRYAKELVRTRKGAAFLHALPHDYYDEDVLHGLMLSEQKDYRQVIIELDRFLPYIDNWAACDLTRPKVFRTHLDSLGDEIRRWMASDHTYTIRFGIGMRLRWYLDEAFRPEYLDEVASIRSKEYYVNMMAAWFFATALDKQYEAALPYLQTRRLAAWIHNRTIQKAVESRRIPEERKHALRSLRLGKGEQI